LQGPSRLDPGYALKAIPTATQAPLTKAQLGELIQIPPR
jgi:hypothetical protein